MKYLSLNNFKVIALRDLEKYVDLSKVPEDANAIIEARKAIVANEPTATP